NTVGSATRNSCKKFSRLASAIANGRTRASCLPRSRQNGVSPLVAESLHECIRHWTWDIPTFDISEGFGSDMSNVGMSHVQCRMHSCRDSATRGLTPFCLDRGRQEARVRPFAMADAKRENFLQELRVAEPTVF